MERPSRMHHHAYVSRDLEATRAFYEEILGLPLAATWCESEFGNNYCHVFFELEDGSSLAFFQFEKTEVTEEHASLASTSPFDHVALLATDGLQADVAERARLAGLETVLVDHGYCRSLYLRDPDGLIVELTVDHPDAVSAAASIRSRARASLDRWLAGDTTDNNDFRRSPQE
ncbi:MAG: VOC family protein [Myxococcota bacterium]